MGTTVGQKEAAGNSSIDESSLISRQNILYGQLILWHGLKVGMTDHEKWGRGVGGTMAPSDPLGLTPMAHQHTQVVAQPSNSTNINT